MSSRLSHGNMDPLLTSRLSLHMAVVELELEYDGNIIDFMANLKEPGNEQNHQNLRSSETVTYCNALYIIQCHNNYNCIKELKHFLTRKITN